MTEPGPIRAFLWFGGSADTPLSYAFLFPACACPGYISPMAERYRCLSCERDEADCDCTKYCAICQGENDCRLWSDGQYYCQECREVCDYQPQSR
jgi:hypothetical protein